MKTFSAARIIFLGVFLSAAAHLQAQPVETPIIQLINEMADKPENHQSIAAYYKTMAEEARAKAAMHEEMKTTYGHDHQTMKNQAASTLTGPHCDRLIELSLAEAEEYEALAALHAGESAE